MGRRTHSRWRRRAARHRRVGEAAPRLPHQAPVRGHLRLQHVPPGSHGDAPRRVRAHPLRGRAPAPHDSWHRRGWEAGAAVGAGDGGGPAIRRAAPSVGRAGGTGGIGRAGGTGGIGRAGGTGGIGRAGGTGGIGRAGGTGGIAPEAPEASDALAPEAEAVPDADPPGPSDLGETDAADSEPEAKPEPAGVE